MANRFDHGGGAVDTTLNTTIGSGDTSLILAASTGWPSGGALGNFGLAIGVIDPVSRDFVSNVEKIKVGSRTGTTCSSLTRGADGTSAAAHTAGETIRHIFLAEEAHQSSEHAGNTTLDEHTQYHNAARHLSTVHTAAMLGTDSVGATQIAANAVGASELADNAVDTAAIANLAVTAGKIANDTITATQIAAGAVGAAEIVAGSIANGAASLATGQELHYRGAVDPGAVGDGKLWFDTSTRSLKVRNAANSAWVLYVEDPATPWATYVPTLFGTTGATVSYGLFKRIGRSCHLQAGFHLPSTGNVTGLIGISLPVNADFTGTNANHKYVIGCWVQDKTGPARYAAAGIIDPSQPDRASRFVNAATVLGFDANEPFDWGVTDVDDELFITGVYQTASPP